MHFDSISAVSVNWICGLLVFLAFLCCYGYSCLAASSAYVHYNDTA